MGRWDIRVLERGLTHPAPPSGSPSSTPTPTRVTTGTPPATATPLAATTPDSSANLETIREEIEGRYADQLLMIGYGAGNVVVGLKSTATAAAADIVARYGRVVQVSVGFFPYPPPPSAAPRGCPIAFPTTADPGPLRAVLVLPSPRIAHASGFPAKVRVTNTGTTTLRFETGQPLSIYLFDPQSMTPIGASPGAVAGTGLGLTLGPGAFRDINAGGGTSSCDLARGYELPDGEYVARAAVEIDQANGPGYFWSESVPIEVITSGQ